MASTKRPRAPSGRKLLHTFRDQDDHTWRVYGADRHTHPHYFDGEENFGLTNRPKREIYIDLGQGDYDKWETTIHELLHVAFTSMGMHAFVEETIVAQLGARMAHYLSQILDS